MTRVLVWLQCKAVVWDPACWCPLTWAFSYSMLLLLASRNSALQALKGLCNVSSEKAQLTVYNLKPLHFPVLYFTLAAFSRECMLKRQKILPNSSLQGFFKGIVCRANFLASFHHLEVSLLYRSQEYTEDQVSAVIGILHDARVQLCFVFMLSSALPTLLLRT